MLTAANQGVQHTIPVRLVGVSTLTGLAASLTLVSPTGVRSTLAYTVGTTNLTVPAPCQPETYPPQPEPVIYPPGGWIYRMTTTTDFPVAGAYTAQIVITGSGLTVASPTFAISVGALE